MPAVDRIEIALSKTKMRAALAGCLGFVALSVWLLSVDEPLPFLPEVFDSAFAVNLVGGIGLAFFGLCGVMVGRKLFDRRPGLVIDHEGLDDNASGVAVGRIPWRDIAGFDDYQLQGQSMVVVRLRDPEPYLARGNALAGAIRRANFKLCGSPVVIAASGLEIGHAELLQTLQSRARDSGPRRD